MTGPMTREQAVALAAKREAHKGRSLYMKEWRAVHDSVKGWHAALVDNPVYLQRQTDAALFEARVAFQRGDLGAFMNAASKSLIAQCKAECSSADDPTPLVDPSEIEELK